MIAWFVASHLFSSFAGGGLLKLFAGNLMGDLKAVVRFLRAHSIWLTVSIVLASCWGVDHVISHRHSSKVEHQLAREIAAHEADRKSYAKGQADAKAKNIAQVARVKQQQQEITDAAVSHLSARLQLIAGELRRQGFAPQSAPSSAPAGDPGAAPCRAIDPAWLCLSPEARLSAAESEERHDELIDWVIAQSNVDPNKP